jgi:asparagine synthase (glutamine-hydrolysing)
MKERISILRGLLEKSVKKCCEKEVASVYSSGIDSAVITFLASEYCKVAAYTVGAKESEDIKCSAKSREDASFKINLIEIDESSVEEILPDLVRLVGLPDPLKVSVGVPLYFAAREAKKDGLSIMLSGQGGDELFGGYNRYLAHAANGDYERLKAAMQKDVDTAYADNLDRDIAICKEFGLDLRFPFMDSDFGKYAANIPADLKVFELKENTVEEFACVDEVDKKRFIRKYFLRLLAADIGLPQYILDRKKKAAQYGSEAEKLIDRIARKNDYKKKAADAGRKDYMRMYLESLV